LVWNIDETQLQKMRAVIDSLNSHVLGEMKKAAEIVDSYVNSVPWQQIVSAVNNYADSIPWQRIQETVGAALTAYQNTIAGIDFSAFQRWINAQIEAIEILSEKGWWPHPDWDSQLLFAVRTLKIQGQGRAIDRFICQTYSRHRFRAMTQIVES
jgi:hypothetical protein